MTDNVFNEFMKYPHCGAAVPCILFFDNEVEYSIKCEKKFQKDKNN